MLVTKGSSSRKKERKKEEREREIQNQEKNSSQQFCRTEGNFIVYLLQY